ncbi:hypothetical protein EV201_1776 [Ancylomarina subtilis]|uniref:Uncharacterized protein n=1 Tax=Ancylomarina subtilis TaxID=1639035 RepID=A0A4Q7VLK4_9BACT|nr:hypothetical protein EV201_1776 [Ancylomarina subtilis]
MFSDSTLIYIIAGITLAHFLFGIGFLLYKLGFGPRKNKTDKE